MGAFCEGAPRRPWDLLCALQCRDGVFAGVAAPSCASVVRLFRMSALRWCGDPAKDRPVRVSPENPHLARFNPRPWLRPLSLG